MSRQDQIIFGALILLSCLLLAVRFAKEMRRRAKVRSWLNEPAEPGQEEGQPAKEDPRRDIPCSVLDVLTEQTRYQITVTDWGPDFTGEYGTLPRFRWVVTDADWRLKEIALTPVRIGTPTVPFMLGNASTPEQAFLDAVAWAERNAYPAQIVWAARA